MYGHIQPINGKNKQKEAIVRARNWIRKNFAGRTFIATSEEVLQAFEKGKVTKIFCRYGKHLIVKMPDGVWYEADI